MEQDETAVNAPATTASEPALPPKLICRALEFLEPNERAINGRLVCKEAAKRLCSRHHRTARFSLPLPLAAGKPTWQPHLQHAFKQTNMRERHSLLSAAAASSCPISFVTAISLVAPGLWFSSSWPDCVQNAGADAVKAGRVDMLRFLKEHDIPINARVALHTAAEQLDIRQLLEVWELLDWQPPEYELDNMLLLLTLAAGSSRCDAEAKVYWLLLVAAEQGACSYSGFVRVAVAAGAAAAGSLQLLRFLQEAGVDLRDEEDARCIFLGDVEPSTFVLSKALEHGHVALADWLVDEAGVPLPQPPPPPQQQQQQQEEEEEDDDEEEEYEEEIRCLWEAAARGCGGVAAMRWLQHRGVAVHTAAMEAAAREGRLQAVQFLHGECGLQLTERVFAEGARSRSLPTMRWLLEAGCPMSPEAYNRAAFEGDAAMVQCLVQEAGCPWGADTLPRVMRCWPTTVSSSREGLEQVVRALVAAGCPLGGTASVDAAAGCGHLPLLRYLHGELGLDFGPGTLAAAADVGCEAVLEWLVAAGCVAGEGERQDPYVAAGTEWGRGMMGCLRRLGVLWDEQVVRRVAKQQGCMTLPVLRWLVEQGAPWDGEAAAEALQAQRRRCHMKDVVAWLEARLAAPHGTDG